MKKKPTKDVLTMVQERIIEIMERGVLPWKKGWVSTQYANLVSGKPYRGLNMYLLSGYTMPYFVTRKQCKDLGGTIKDDAKENLVVFWKPMQYINEKKETKTIPFLRYFYVFNTNDCIGLKHKRLDEWNPNKFTHVELDAANYLIDNYSNECTIHYGHSMAAYSPSMDHILMPDKTAFKVSEHFYATCFHEMVHSTGHEKRLDRSLSVSFGSERYGKEELVAELGASYLCALHNIDTETIERSASYIDGWIKSIKGDKQLLVSASSAAQKAVKFIQSKCPVTLKEDPFDLYV